MIVLAIESATEAVGAALRDGGRTRAAVTVPGRRRHAECLAPAIAAVLGRAGTPLSAVQVIAVDLGPGLFTGLRVGVSTAKGLSQGLGVGVLGATSLEILAAAAFDTGWTGSVVPVVDARRGEVFAARYGRHEVTGAPTELSAPGRYRPERVGPEVAAGAEGAVLAVGDGALRYRDLLEEVGGLGFSGHPASPDPAALAALVAARLEGGAEPVAASLVAPVYLREPDARIQWRQRAPVAAAGD